MRFRGIINTCVPDCSGCALIVQLAETEDLKSLCSGFESQWGHCVDRHVDGQKRVAALPVGEEPPLACLKVYVSGGLRVWAWCLKFKRRCPRPILSGASQSGGAGYRIPRTLFTAGRCGRPLPEPGRLAVNSGEPTGDCLPSGIMCGGRKWFKAYLRRAVISASMENLPAPLYFVVLFMPSSLTSKVLHFK